MDKVNIEYYPEFMSGIEDEEWVDASTSYFDYKVKTHLSINDYANMIDSVIAMCFEDEDEAANVPTEFHPEAVDVAIRIHTIMSYTNIDISSNPFPICFNSGIYNAVLDIIDRDQYESIIKAIKRTIQYRLDSKHNYYQNRIAQKALDALNTVAIAIRDAINNPETFLQSVVGENFGQVVKEFETLFNNVANNLDCSESE